MNHVAFATVNEKGEPRVAPLDGVFVRGRFTVSTDARGTGCPTCARIPRAASSGPPSTAARRKGDSDVAELDRVWTEIYGSSPFSWGTGVVFMIVEPSSMWAYAFHPENFPA